MPGLALRRGLALLILGLLASFAASASQSAAPRSSPDRLYGDNSEQMLKRWSGGSGGSAWTVHQYENRYVVWTEGRGTYVIGRGRTGARIPGFPNNYMGPGYIGQFSPREATPTMLLVNDPLNPGTLGPRDALHGGLGCFAMDLYRSDPLGKVDLHCRLLSNGQTPGVFQVTRGTVSGDALGVTVGMTTRYRDATGPVFDVTYSHRFTAGDVKTTYTWQSTTTNDDVYIKEPRIVAVLGSSDIPVQQGSERPGCVGGGSDGTSGGGSGVWALKPTLDRNAIGVQHRGMETADPRACLPTVGPGATQPASRYNRGGFSFNVAGVPRALVYDNAGSHDYDADTALNFNAWRRNAESAPSPPGYQRLSICDACAANAWEFGRLSGQHGVTMALMGWRASITLDHFWGRARRIPDYPTSYSQAFRF